MIGRVAGRDRTIAVDVSPDVDLRVPGDSALQISGWRMLWRRLNPYARHCDVPHIASLLTRSSVVPSIISNRERRKGDARGLYLELATAHFGMFEFEMIDEICEAGYASAAQEVSQWWSRRAAH